MNEPTIIHEAAGVIAIRKPAGLATQAPPGIESVEAWLRARLHGGDPGGYVGVPHRLDRAVSGVVLMAASPRAARKLSRQFERREIGKVYVAVVAPAATAADVASAGPQAEWRDLVEKVPDEARSRIVAAGSPGGREAVTLVTPERVVDGAQGRRVLLRLEPLTGRMHQLRLQAASRGLPIVGDLLYGGPLDAADEMFGREPPIMLHAWRISYADPDSAAPTTVEADLPDHWPAWARPTS